MGLWLGAPANKTLVVAAASPFEDAAASRGFPTAPKRGDDSHHRRNQIETVNSRPEAEGGLSAVSCQPFGLIGHTRATNKVKGGGGVAATGCPLSGPPSCDQVRCVRNRGPGPLRRGVAVLSAGRPCGRLQDPGG